jgi:two-component system chemotaxis response regulator CheY
MHVLVADDDAGIRLLVSVAIERLGHRCTTAEDGLEAWRRYQAEQPDVVITDWQMPGMDGTELALAIRSHAESPYTYLLVLTGVADEAAARAVMEAGADDLVLKPLEAAELERKLIAAARVTALHRRMHDDARQDPLTGLGNRLRLAEDLDALCGRVERYGHSYCVALFDVDAFKAYNDSVGHLAGDGVLRAVADRLSEGIRTGDTLYRYGGEEFLVLLPEQSLESARRVAERLRASVEALELPHPESRTVTVSAGVAGIGVPACSPTELFELADQALYRAKAGGRNRVEVHRGPEDPAGTIRVVIADDDAGVRLTVGALLRREAGFELVGEATDANEAMALVERNRPDIVLLDLDMPGGGGVRAAFGIRDASPATRIVALSANSTHAAQFDMTRAGAVGYLVKGAADDEIVRVIRSSVRW